MNQTIRTTRKQAASILNATFPEYRGHKVTVEFTDKVHIYDTNWGGGTKNTYKAIAGNGRLTTVFVPAPWENMIEGTSYPLGTNVLVVMHSHFCGKDCGITIFANPIHLPKWLND